MPITPNIFFAQMNLCTCSKRTVPFKTSIDFFYVVKVTKFSHHLSHDQANKGHGSIPCLMSQTDLHGIKSL